MTGRKLLIQILRLETMFLTKKDGILSLHHRERDFSQIDFPKACWQEVGKVIHIHISSLAMFCLTFDLLIRHRRFCCFCSAFKSSGIAALAVTS